MLRYIIAVLDRAAPSFCHYPTPNAAPERMPLSQLQALVDYAVRHGLALNCLLGGSPLPDGYERALSAVPHVLLVPFELRAHYPSALLVLGGRTEADALEADPVRNVILRVGRAALPHLAETVEALLPKCGRLNLRLLEVESFDDVDIATYRREVTRVADALSARYAAGDMVEVEFLSDRLLLPEMRNCEAGVQHLTFAAGGFHICPAFFHAGAEPVGDLDSGVRVVNGQLLRRERAPICTICDAFQCKRCVWLNQRTTGELNTPSRQQCVTAHLERNASADLLGGLRHLPPFSAMRRLVRVDRLDPFERIAFGRGARAPLRVRDGHALVTLPPLERVRPGPPRPPAAAALAEQADALRREQEALRARLAAIEAQLGDHA